MKREELERAIVATEQLLSRPGTPESECQSLFEQHSIIWQALNYDRWVPRPRLNLEGGGWRCFGASSPASYRPSEISKSSWTGAPQT